MESILEAIYEGFVFIGHADPAAEVEYLIIVIQRQDFQIILQFFESFLDARRIVFVGFCVGSVQLIQHRLAIRVAGVNGVVFRASLQQLQ